MEFSKPGSIAAERPRARVGAAYSALVGWGAGREVPSRLRGLAYRAFARAVGANLDEVELELAGYPSLGDFFARRLRQGVRAIDPDPAAIISPCDGVLAARGTASGGALVQAKGRTYQLAELVADGELAARLTGGPYATIYLSPRDYHRVHAPVDAQIVGYDYLPGALWPVNPRVAARRDGLLARNERVVIRMNAGPLGHVALVMVGASGVGNIRLAHGLTGPDGTTGGPIDSALWRAAAEPRRVELSGVSVARGDELGAFRLGSTVVLVFEPRQVELDGEVGQVLRFGQRIGLRRGTLGPRSTPPGGAS
ncbi:MAG TPA: archaetidylserine decarboxylase [Kofleriaceae bacterium]|nr:archaetidylserine decarboxylase [Kofleriaceae bacterium]